MSSDPHTALLGLPLSCVLRHRRRDDGSGGRGRPRRDVGLYVDEAADRGLVIERVIETHVHADFLSGHLSAARTGAVISYGEEADVEFPIEPLADGQRLSLGEVTLEILATPGHTPESICIVIYEHDADEVPYGVLTGDTLFVGDVGRPDLLASAGAGLSAEALARRLYRSLYDKLLPLPDSTRIFPAHGAGSSCGKQLSSETTRHSASSDSSTPRSKRWTRPSSSSRSQRGSPRWASLLRVRRAAEPARPPLTKRLHLSSTSKRSWCSVTPAPFCSTPAGQATLLPVTSGVR